MLVTKERFLTNGAPLLIIDTRCEFFDRPFCIDLGRFDLNIFYNGLPGLNAAQDNIVSCLALQLQYCGVM
mgnify:CR=1 FL=1